MIKLLNKYKSAVLIGVKTQTIRMGMRDQELGAEELVFEDSQQFPIYVTKVRYKRVDELEVKDANKDGFETLDDLKKALRDIYPDITETSQVTLIEWRML